MATHWLDTAEVDQVREFTTYCVECGEPAVDKQALSVHMFRAHGSRRFIRRYVPAGNSCLVCGLLFASRQRLIDHLAEKSAICAHNFVLRFPLLEPAVVDVIDRAAHSDHPRRLRVDGAHGVRTFGPYLPIFNLNGQRILTRHPLGPNRRWRG